MSRSTGRRIGLLMALVSLGLTRQAAQDGAVQVLGFQTEPTHVWVRWPGGVTSTVAVMPNVAEVTVTNKVDFRRD